MREYIEARKQVLRTEEKVRKFFAYLRRYAILFYFGIIPFWIIYYGETNHIIEITIFVVLFLLACLKWIWLSTGDLIIWILCSKRWKEANTLFTQISTEEKIDLLDPSQYKFELSSKLRAAEFAGFTNRKLRYHYDGVKVHLSPKVGNLSGEVVITNDFKHNDLNNGQTYSFNSRTHFHYNGLELRQEQDLLVATAAVIAVEHNLLIEEQPCGIKIIMDFSADKLTKFGTLYYKGIAASALFTSSKLIREYY